MADLRFKLRVRQGKLQNRRGDRAGTEIKIRRSGFVIGSSEDCHMRCKSSAVSGHHCELQVRANSLYVRDLESETGTRVNGRQIDEETLLVAGDEIEIARLKFEIVVDTPVVPPTREVDPMGDFVSDMLAEADQEDRQQRMEDPRKRIFVSETGERAAPAEETPEQALPKRPEKKPAGKLPPPAPFVTDTTIEAAEETLKKIFERPKR